MAKEQRNIIYVDILDDSLLKHKKRSSPNRTNFGAHLRNLQKFLKLMNIFWGVTMLLAIAIESQIMINLL